jgi:hypothetical protein
VAVVVADPVLLAPTLCLPPLKMSIFQEAALLLADVSLAAGGVQLVASLLETLSIVAELALLPLPPAYHEG